MIFEINTPKYFQIPPNIKFQQNQSRGLEVIRASKIYAYFGYSTEIRTNCDFEDNGKMTCLYLGSEIKFEAEIL